MSENEEEFGLVWVGKKKFYFEEIGKFYESKICK